MTWWRRRRVLVVAAVVVAVASSAAVAAAYLQRISPPWPSVEGDPYTMALDADGCPVVPEQVHFVDAPGQLVPPDPIEVVLCTTPTGSITVPTGAPYEPRVRVLRTGAASFAAVLNGLPDRNADWRQWQRKHSGWWPDAVPADYGKFCLMIGYPYEYSFVVRYASRPPVPLIAKCGTWGWTTGVRTRIDSNNPHVVDLFLQRFTTQR